MLKERTLDDVVMYFIQAVALPLSERDYRTLDISLFDFIKRRRFPDVFRALLICLIYHALPVAFPQYAAGLREVLEEVFDRAYESYRIEGKPTPEVVRALNEMVDLNAGQPFFKMATHIAEIYSKSPLKTEHAEKLNKRLEQIYANFSTLGDDVQIVEKKG